MLVIDYFLALTFVTFSIDCAVSRTLTSFDLWFSMFLTGVKECGMFDSSWGDLMQLKGRYNPRTNPQTSRTLIMSVKLCTGKQAAYCWLPQHLGLCAWYLPAARCGRDCWSPAHRAALLCKYGPGPLSAENPPLLFCILICRCCFFQSANPSPVMHGFVVCVCDEISISLCFCKHCCTVQY